MEDLIKALQIFVKYSNPRNPCHCEHDILPATVSKEDKEELDKLGFLKVMTEKDLVLINLGLVKKYSIEEMTKCNEEK